MEQENKETVYVARVDEILSRTGTRNSSRIQRNHHPGQVLLVERAKNPHPKRQGSREERWSHYPLGVRKRSQKTQIRT